MRERERKLSFLTKDTLIEFEIDTALDSGICDTREKIVTTEKTCFVAWYKKEKTSVKNIYIFYSYQKIADVFLQAWIPYVMIVFMCENCRMLQIIFC